MLFLKPIFRTVVLSLILAFLIIYLGIKYHWSDYLKAKTPNHYSTLKFPAKTINSPEMPDPIKHRINKESFVPEIISTKGEDELISSMNKDQVTQLCQNLLKKSIQDTNQLEIAVVNCVVSNYQETLQTHNAKDYSHYLHRKEKVRNECQRHFASNNSFTNIEKQLLIGICTSDKLTQ